MTQTPDAQNSATAELPEAAERYKDELNFAEFPLASLADYVPPGQKTLVFVDPIFDKGANQAVTRKLTISASDEYGLPRGLDEEVILGLIQLTNRQIFKDRRVYFSSYELIKLLGWGDSARSYKRIEEALLRWLGVTLYYDRAWWSKDDQCWVSENFHVLDGVTIYDRQRRATSRAKAPGDPNAGKSSFVWNEVVFRSFQAGNLKEIDLDVYRELRSSIAKRLYRFLDKRFYYRAHLEFDLAVFAFEKIGIARTDNIAEVKRALSKAIGELEAIGFVVARPKEERFVKQQKGAWKVRFEKGASEGLTALNQDQIIAVGALKERQVTAATAAKLVRQQSLSRIAEKIGMQDWMVAHGDKRCSENPSGFLVAAIQNDYPVPAAFLKSRDQQKAELAVVSGQPRPPRAPAPPRQAEEPVTASLETQFDLWWSTRDETEKRVFETKAVERADGFKRKTYEERREGGGLLFVTVQRQLLLEQFKLDDSGRLTAPDCIE